MTGLLAKMQRCLLLAAILIPTLVWPARADIHECRLKKPVAIKDAKTGEPLGRLKAGTLVYERLLQFLPHTLTIVEGPRFRNIVGPLSSDLDCESTSRSPEYPIVFDKREDLNNAFGLNLTEPTSVLETPDHPLGCNWRVVAHTSAIRMTPGFFEPYRRKGFALEQLCMVLLSGQVRFDPETGERLPTYVLVKTYDSNGKSTTSRSDELPLVVPDCFAEGRVSRPQSFISLMSPTGCQMKYHPWSGRKLAEPEQAFFTRLATLLTSSEAGEVQEDSLNLAADASRRASKAKIQAIRARMSR